MKELKPFKLGATYRLRPGCENKVQITPSMKRFGVSIADLRQFTVGEGNELNLQKQIMINGVISVGSDERKYYQRIGNKKVRTTSKMKNQKRKAIMKELKPFKLGATYRLRPGCEHKIPITSNMEKACITIADLRQFTVGDGNKLTLLNQILIDMVISVASDKRKYYRRIDNKKAAGIQDNITPATAQALESGHAEVQIKPTASFGPKFALFINGDVVYCPSDEGKADTYTACAEELIRYLNSY